MKRTNGKQKLENMRTSPTLSPSILSFVTHTADDLEQSSSWIQWRFFRSGQSDLLHIILNPTSVTNSTWQSAPAAAQDRSAVKLQPNTAGSPSACDQRACLKHVSHVWPAETNPDPDILSHHHEKEFWRVWPRLRHLVSPLWQRETSEQGMERVTSLRPSVRVLARETTGKLMWQSVLEPTREAGKGEWALSFFGVGVEKARADSVNGVYSWGVNDLHWRRRQCERSSSLPDWVQTVGWHSGLQQTHGILFVTHCNNNGDRLLMAQF